MSKSLQDLIKQQQAHTEMVSKHLGALSASDTMAKTHKDSLNVIVANQRSLSATHSLSRMFDRDRLASIGLLKMAAPVVPSYISDAINLAKNTAESTALSQAKAIIDSSDRHHFIIGSAIKKLELGNASKSMAIGAAIGRLTKNVSPFFVSETFALERFKSLGRLVHSAEAFGETHSKALRASLGDWRGTLAVLTSTQSLYVTQGFDRGLTALPDEEFYGVVSDAGLNAPSSDIELFGPVIVGIGDEEVSQEERNAKCYARLYRLETRLRNFILEAMTAKFGKGWIKQLPNDVRENLKEIQHKKKGAGENRALIECTDFSHYIKIISKGDLWRDVFSPLFGTRRKEDVQESLNRLKPIRDTAMHSNPVSHEDWLMLYVETGRLLKIISKLQ